MTYHATIDEDLALAKSILQRGRDYIFELDNVDAYKLLESFVAEIARMREFCAILKAENDQAYAVLEQEKQLVDQILARHALALEATHQTPTTTTPTSPGT